MEIILQGAPAYGIANWTGAIEVDALKVYQYKRLANSRGSITLFRKFLKVISGPDSPVKLPEGLAPKNLLVNDFMQCLLGVALSHSTETQKTFECANCGAKNPRVVKLTQVYNFKPPKNPLPSTGLDLADGKIMIRPLTIGQYLQVQDYVTVMFTLGKPADLEFKIIPMLQEKYGDVMPVQDKEDADDLDDILLDVGMVAIASERKDMDFDALVKYFMAMQGEDTKAYTQVDQGIQDMAPTLESGYEDKCHVCKKKFIVEVSPTAYFFDTP